MPTPRQTEVLNLVVKGFSNPEIADILGITARTVKAHCKALFAEYKVANRVQLIVEVNDGQRS